MQVSLYQRLSGAWLGATWAAAQHQALSQPWQSSQQLWQQLIEAEAKDIPVSSNALENCLVLLPLMLFFHEDPLYLKDQLQARSVALVKQPVLTSWADLLSALMRERLSISSIPHWLSRQSQLSEPASTLLIEAIADYRLWHTFCEQLVERDIDAQEASLLMICGAAVWGKGNIQTGLSLVKAQDPLVQILTVVLLGITRGDRHFPLSWHHTLAQNHNLSALHQSIQQFWSCWSGLPSKNQLQLDQIPTIASCQVIKPRPALQLVSQRHLP